DDFIEAVAQGLDLDTRHHALVASAAVETIEALARHAHQLHAGALGDRGEILAASVLASLVQKNFHHRGRVSTQPRQHRVESEDHPGLALAAHAGTRSILRWSTSTRTSLTFMRSVRRKRFLERSPNRRWRGAS